MIKTNPISNASISTAWQGAFWKVLSCAAFACINGIIRYISKGANGSLEPLPAAELLFFQESLGALCILPFIFKTGPQIFITHYFSLHLARVVTAALGVLLWYMSLRYMPIAEALALAFTGPIISVLGATFILREKLTFKRFLAISLSLTGAFLITRPDTPFSEGGMKWGLFTLLPLGSALVMAMSKICSRRLGILGESPERMTVYLFFFIAPVALLPAFFEWVTPNLNHLPWLLLLGALATFAYFALNKAYVLAEVTFLVPFGFSKFFFSTAVGFLAFAEFPTSKTAWFGIVAILGSLLVLYARSKKV